MRILQLANLITPTSGEIRTVVERLGEGYLRAGHERVVVVPGSRPASEHRADRTHWIELPGRRLPNSGGYRVLTDRTLVRRTLRSMAPDAIEIHDRFTLPWVAPWAARQGIATTLVVHERLETTLRHVAHLGVLAPMMERAANRRLIRRVGGVVVASPYSAEGFRGDPRVQVIPLGVDPARFRPLDPGSTGGADAASAGILRLVQVARLSREKRPGLALDVSHALVRRGVHHELVLIGDGPLRPRLEARVRQDRLPVTFRGHVAAREVAAALVGADVALATCPTEAFGLAALEALACGLAVVTVASGAVPALLGIPSPQRRVTTAGATADADGERLAEAVLAVRRIDPQVRGHAARARAAEYRWDRTVAAMLTRHGAGRPTPHARPHDRLARA
ncbi:MAG: glycosyltransferase [Nitriliruptoraceae bacterium]|nr:glycosyltransferase [Nitriliruptoraceae bacterium]